MKRYQFRMARVLRVRRLQEELLRAAWLEARARADAAAAAEAAQARELELGRVELARLQGAGTLAPTAVLAQLQVLERGERELARLSVRTRTLEAEAGRRADVLREARAAVRGLERLDERRRRAHGEERDRREQAQTDEDAARRFAGEPSAASERARAVFEPALSSPSVPAADSDLGSLPSPHPAP